MSSVLISSRSFTEGPEVAAAVAEALGLEMVGESLYEVAEQHFAVPADALQRAMEQGPSLCGMSSSRRRRLAWCVRATLARRLTEADAVYHAALCGQFLRGIAHLLKVRITASPEARCKAAAGSDVPESQALRRVEASDRVQNEIARMVFGLDDLDSDYDLVIDLSQTERQGAVDEIVAAAQSPACRPTTFSKNQLRDRQVAQELAARLACDLSIEVDVRVHGGTAEIRAQAPERKREKIRARAESHAAVLEGIDRISVETVDSWLNPLPASLR